MHFYKRCRTFLQAGGSHLVRPGSWPHFVLPLIVMHLAANSSGRRHAALDLAHALLQGRKKGFFSSFTSYHLLKTYSSLAFTYLTLSQADSILAKRRCYEGQYSIWNSLNLVISEDPLNIFWKKQGIVIAAVEYTWEGKHLTSWLTCTNMSPQMQDALVLELLCIPALIRPSVSFM